MEYRRGGSEGKDGLGKKLNLDEKRARRADQLASFVGQYARKARRGGLDPNDRRYDRSVEREVKRLPPIEFDALLRGDER